MMSTFVVGPGEYLNKKVDVFAVKFKDFGWIAFRGNVEKEKFKIWP
jgi:hypothetical protein